MITRIIAIALLTFCVACDGAPAKTETSSIIASGSQAQGGSGAPAAAFVSALSARGILIRDELATSPLHLSDSATIKAIKIVNASSEQQGCENNQQIARAERINQVNVVTLCIQSLVELYSDVAFSLNQQIVNTAIVEKYAESYIANNSIVSTINRGEGSVERTDLSCGFFEFIYWENMERKSESCIHNNNRTLWVYAWVTSENSANYLANKELINATFVQPEMEKPERKFREKWEFIYTLNRDTNIPSLYFELIDFLIAHEICHVVSDDLNSKSTTSVRSEMQADLCALDTLRSIRPDFDVAGTSTAWMAISTLFIARQFLGEDGPDRGALRTMNDRVRGGIDAAKSQYARSSPDDPGRRLIDEKAHQAGYGNAIDFLESFWVNRPAGLISGQH